MTCSRLYKKFGMWRYIKLLPHIRFYYSYKIATLYLKSYMAQTNIESLIDHLRYTSRTRVGLWRFPLAKIGHEAEFAVRFGVEGLDVSAYMRERLPIGAEFVRLSEQKVLDTLDEIASSPST